MRISSNIEKESIYNIRNLLRHNRMFHKTYKPSLETIGYKKFLDGVYTPNEPDTSEDILMGVTEFAF